MSYLSLEDAAAKLGIPTDRLVELRSQGQVRGFRDGASWKFPETEIDRLADEIGDSASGGSGVLASESGGSGTGSHIIGGDAVGSQEGGGSDLEVGDESLKPGSDSDVNVVPSQGDDSDVAVVASGDKEGGSGLEEIDSADLTLEDPAVTHDSVELDLASETKSDSTGPIKQEDLDEAAASNQAADEGQAGQSAGDSTGDSGLTYDAEEDSGDELLGADVLEEADQAGGEQGSSFQLQPELGASGRKQTPSDEKKPAAPQQPAAGDDADDQVELAGSDAPKQSSGSGSGSDAASALADDDDDDLVISDDDDDLVINSGGSDLGSDISVAGDSGINLMSPSDSGLSLESEPLDLAGSSVSELDLGAELGEGGSGSGPASGADQAGGSGDDFQSDEEFQLSPSGVGIEEEDSGSQVIEVEDSEAIAEPVEFGEADFGDEAIAEEDVFAEDAVGLEEDELATETGAAPRAAGGGYEVPFSMLQVLSLAGIVCILALSGMLMTDLMRNMWTYSEPAAPVSSLTDSLVSLAGWGQ